MWGRGRGGRAGGGRAVCVGGRTAGGGDGRVGAGVGRMGGRWRGGGGRRGRGTVWDGDQNARKPAAACGPATYNMQASLSRHSQVLAHGGPCSRIEGRIPTRRGGRLQLATKVSAPCRCRGGRGGGESSRGMHEAPSLSRSPLFAHAPVHRFGTGGRGTSKAWEKGPREARGRDSRPGSKTGEQDRTGKKAREQGGEAR